MPTLLDDVQIKYLADVPQFIPTLAEWTFAAWGKYDPTLSVAGSIESLHKNLNKDKIPLTFVVLKEDQPIATVTLKPSVKVTGYADRDLWLGSFWVLDGYRDQGVGLWLLEQAYRKARELGFNKISLFASDPNAALWYAQHGWRKFAVDTYQNHTVSLLEHDL